jgi:multiple antibiotic resistance protein
MTLFIATFSTLFAIINPLEALPVFIGLVTDKGEQERIRIVGRACLHAVLLMFFFLVFGTVILRVFGIPLSMVRIVGGIILVRLGFTLFSSSAAGVAMGQAGSGQVGKDDGVAFVPLVMPIMFGPGAIATVLGMTSLVKQSESELTAFAEISAAILATMLATYLVLRAARMVLDRIGPRGIDAATRIVGFFVSAMGMGLVFLGRLKPSKQMAWWSDID